MELITHNIPALFPVPPQYLRNAQREGQKSRVNLKAKIEQNQRPGDSPPALRVKQKGGAPKGNRNALRHGLYSGALADLRRRARLCIALLRLAAAEYDARAAAIDAETSMRLSAARCPAWPRG